MAITGRAIVTNATISLVCRKCVLDPLTSALSGVAGPAAVPVVGVQHGDVAALVL